MLQSHPGSPPSLCTLGHAVQGELAEAHAQRQQLESQLAALQQQLEQALQQQLEQGQQQQAGQWDEAAGEALGATDVGEAAGLGSRSPALPATPTAAAISNPAFSPDREVAELHQQARLGAGRGCWVDGAWRPRIRVAGACSWLCSWLCQRCNLLLGEWVNQSHFNHGNCCFFVQLETLQEQLVAAEQARMALQQEVEQLRALGVQQVGLRFFFNVVDEVRCAAAWHKADSLQTPAFLWCGASFVYDMHFAGAGPHCCCHAT